VLVSDVALAFERFQRQPRLLIDLVLVFASGDTSSFKEVLDQHIDRIIADSSFQPVLDRMTRLQRLVCQRLNVASDLTSAEARKGYALALHKKAVPSGSVGDALRALVDQHVLTKPTGSRGHYAFDDPMFREWFSKEKPLWGYVTDGKLYQARAMEIARHPLAGKVMSGAH